MTNTAWKPAPIPGNERERLNELINYQILDTPSEISFDRLTRMAARRFNMPISLISLVDKGRQWFKSRHGIEAMETPRDVAFCSYVILQDDVMVVHDTKSDPRFASNPLVIDKPDIRFYAGAPLKSSCGHVLGTICVIDRVPRPEFSEQDKMELADLAAIAMDEMELRLAVKTMKKDLEALEAVQHALEIAREKAERATEEKSQFIASISHELRTPMNGILGMAYLLKDTPLEPVQKEYIDTINHSAQNLLLLINDVLDLSKIEAAELIIERAAFDVKTDFAQTINLLRPLAKNKHISLVCTIDESVPAVVTSDRGRFMQIVTNLVGNAIKFTENGKVEVNLRYDQKNANITCEVKDSGIGIPAHKREAIFEKFVQGDSAITQKYGGTGLGLAITKQLVVMLGGQIGFESKENQGSCFWFLLPATPPDDHAVQLNSAKRSAPASGRKDTKSARILIAEDHSVNQLFLIALLKKFGFVSIDVAENGLQVMTRLQQNASGGEYDAILMDCRMPEQDGYETTRLIRQREIAVTNGKHIPIIAMTANALAGDRDACFEAGMDEYLSKPLQPERLKDALSRWFVFPSETETLNFLMFSDMESSGPPLDFERLNMVARSQQEKSAILCLFLSLAEDFILTMENSRRDKEFENWRNAAHSLRGSAANLGMFVLEDLCTHSEKARASTYKERTLLCMKIREEIERIKHFLLEQHPTLMNKV